MELQRELELLRESWTETFDQLFVLYEVAREVSSVLDLDSVLEHIVNHAFLLLEAEAACVLLVDRKTGRLIPRVIKHEKGQETKKDSLHIEFGKGIAGEVASSRKPIIITQDVNEKQFREDSEIFKVKTPRNLLCVPIVLRGGDTIGVIEIINKKNKTFTSRDRDFLMAIANISALSVENAKVYEQLKNNEVYQSQVIENLPEGFFAINGSGKITHMNSCAQKLLGLESDGTLLGQTCDIVLKEESELNGYLKAAMTEGRVKKWQEISLRKTGKPVFLFTFVFRKEDNSVLGAGAVLQDMVLKR